MDPDKRQRRIEKRELKRAGNQRLRRRVKQQLAEGAEEAGEIEADYGRCRTSGLNGLDRDATRRRPGEPDAG